MEYKGAIMGNDEIVSTLNDLIETDHNAIGAYNTAIDGLNDQPTIRDNFIQFRGDHERHIEELSPFVRQYGGEPEKSPGGMGVLQKGWTAVSKLGGADAILSAMVSNEESAVSAYEEGATKNFPPEILQSVEKGLRDERRHLAYCQGEYARLKKAA
ncbi:MAG: PA2169 family four-helix-bundle protein [Nitrospirae bacterium]|nr:PA2169 family four-helix-bundle protein [Candidatus Manganitrophaceae bacterium]